MGTAERGREKAAGDGPLTEKKLKLYVGADIKNIYSILDAIRKNM